MLTAFRHDLLTPVVIERALLKLQGRLQERPQKRPIVPPHLAPRLEANAVEFVGQGDVGRVFAGLMSSQAVASLPIPSWNQINVWLRSMASLREVAA